ncbi:hypothetical protein L195_g040717 [Trifolium pratense]|uniref:RNase H type-1 domain-containing protein n=1 Tax=Trifolium pratense TaxID=57577 RepID=A0A2K3M1K5_TRIPR|nr:hypothetical protein L195_g040717 [Trifolium pratense]
MALTKIQLTFQDVAVFFETATIFAWLVVRKLETCDALYAEMWGMYIGMDLAWRQGIRRLQVDSDS